MSLSLCSLLRTVLVSCRVILQVNKSFLVGLDVTFQTTIEAGSIIRPFRNLVCRLSNHQISLLWRVHIQNPVEWSLSKSRTYQSGIRATQPVSSFHLSKSFHLLIFHFLNLFIFFYLSQIRDISLSTTRSIYIKKKEKKRSIYKKKESKVRLVARWCKRIMLAEEKFSFRVVNTDFKTQKVLIFLSNYPRLLGDPNLLLVLFS